jgi:hypothetical protein
MNGNGVERILGNAEEMEMTLARRRLRPPSSSRPERKEVENEKVLASLLWFVWL